MTPLQPTIPSTGVMRSMRLWLGKKITPFTGRNIFSVGKHNEQLAVSNCFLNGQVVPQSAGNLTITDSGWALDLTPVASGQNQSGAASISPFQVATVGQDRFTGYQLSFDANGSGSIGGLFSVAFPWLLRIASRPFNEGAIVPGLNAGQIVYCSNLGLNTGIPGVTWLWLNSDGMAWGRPQPFKDSNTCQTYLANFVMTEPVKQ